jgi:hypothetical protein
MAGFQTIINACDAISIDRRKVVGIQFTRNEEPRTTQTPTLNPWKFTVTVPNSFRYNEARSLIEAIDHLDRITPEIISFGANPRANWIFRYQGSMSTNQINNITVSSFVGSTLTLTNLPAIPATRSLFEPNDLIQIGTVDQHPFPFTSVNQVLRGTGSTVTVETNRPNIISTSTVGSSIIVGTNCQFKVFCPNMPTYKLYPGGYKKINNVVVNNAYIEWSDDFILYEYVADA